MSNAENQSSPIGVNAPEEDGLSKGERTRVRLKAAAEKVLGERGYHGMRVADVCREADVSQGTFYLYFKNKHDLTIELVQAFLEHGEQQMRGGSTGGGPFETIFAATRAYVDVLHDNAPLARALLQLADEDALVAEMWQRSTRDWLKRITHDMERRCGAGRTTESSRWFVAYAMNWMVDGFLHSLLLRGDPYMEAAVAEIDDLAEALSVLWYRAVYGVDPNPATLSTPQARALLHLRLAPSPPTEEARDAE